MSGGILVSRQKLVKGSVLSCPIDDINVMGGSSFHDLRVEEMAVARQSAFPNMMSIGGIGIQPYGLRKDGRWIFEGLVHQIGLN
jgi:hypothetical protein